MPKNIIAILPSSQFDQVSVSDDRNHITYVNEKGYEFQLPIEEYELDGKKFLFARYSKNVTEEEIEQAIKRYH